MPWSQAQTHVPEEQLQLTNTAPSSTNIAVFLTTLTVNSTDSQGPLPPKDNNRETFLEGCLRVMDNQKLHMLVSSGTEDYFLGTYYFDLGTYQMPQAGLTYLDTHVRGSGTSFAAYRVHTVDPLVLPITMALTWRNGDPEGCDLEFNLTDYQSAVAVSAFTLAYQW